jgi:glucosamine--fructose-6-phosphate aminotransferase (isomerizing)
MCGILGIIGGGDVTSSLIDGLRQLEYRGYDSAGVATLENGHISRRRAEGKLVNLTKKLEELPLGGTVGIGHTRWATHGPPVESNAHPHATDRVAVVHNGIIENYRVLRRELESEGCLFQSETDTETIAHLVTKYLRENMTPVEAASAAFRRLEGTFALALIFAGEHNLMIGARRGSPLVVGHCEGRMYLASDAMALAPFTNKISYLQEGDWVELSPGGARFRDSGDRVIQRGIQASHVSARVDDKRGYRHHMHKEIHEQPKVINDTLAGLLDPRTEEIVLPGVDLDAAGTASLDIVACGSGYYAGMVGKYWIEQLACLPVNVDIASEFRYRVRPVFRNALALFVSQSGETADTLEALRNTRKGGQRALSIVNVPESSIARESDAVMRTLAGPEIGVASTKATICQLTVLACFAIALARKRCLIGAEEERGLTRLLRQASGFVDDALLMEEQVKNVARAIAGARDVLYLGRGSIYPIAMEGALKLKEISYIHAEGYAAGEMKHGPIALIDKRVCVIVLAPYGELFAKTASNVQEIAARGGKILLISTRRGIEELSDCVTWSIEMPEVPPFIAPIVYSVPVQLIAYHVAVMKGTDVDQPRNLAKSVTVE